MSDKLDELTKLRELRDMVEYAGECAYSIDERPFDVLIRRNEREGITSKVLECKELEPK